MPLNKSVKTGCSILLCDLFGVIPVVKAKFNFYFWFLCKLKWKFYRNLQIMKSNFLFRSRSCFAGALKTATCLCAIFLLHSVASFAQGNSSTDFSSLTGKEWKPSAEVVSVLQDQSGFSDILLSDAQISPDEKAVQMLHKRVASVVIDEIQSGKGVLDALVKGYEKVQPEVSRNPDFSLVPEGYLDNHMLILAELFSAVPEPVSPGSGN